MPAYRIPKENLMNAPVFNAQPASGGVGLALETTLRGVQELLPQDEWV